MFVVNDYPRSDSEYSWLKQLLLHNHNIKVLNRRGEICTDGSSIDKFYALNRIYNGSAQVIKEPALIRHSLVAAALIENASKDFQFTALLLFQQTDVLFDFLQGLPLEEHVFSLGLAEETDSSKVSERAPKKSRST